MMNSSHTPLRGFPLVLLTIALSLAVFMEVLDTTIANVALPHIAGDLGAATSQGTWVITSFAVANAVSVSLTGWAARRVGEVRLFLLGVLMFVITSWLCGIAQNMTMLIIARMMQGLFSGVLMTLSQSLLFAAYPEEKRDLALAFWGMTVITAPIVGPILGGWIVDRAHWGWIFFINIPIGVFSYFVSRHYLKNRETMIAHTPTDRVGLILLILGVGALQMMLDHGREVDWFASPLIVVLAVIAVICLSYLVVWELGCKYPIVDLSLFKDRNFTVGSICVSLAFLLYMGTVVLMPLVLQTQLGYTATWSGLVTAPVGIIPILIAPIFGRFGHHIDVRWVVTFSFLAFAACFLWRSSTFTTNMDLWHVILPQFFTGFAIGTFFLPLSSITLSKIPQQQIAQAASLSNAMRVLAGGIGTSVFMTLWEKREVVHHHHLTETFDVNNPIHASWLQTLQASGLSEQQAQAITAMQITQQGFLIAASELYYISSGLFLIMLLVVWFAKPPFHIVKDAH